MSSRFAIVSCLLSLSACGGTTPSTTPAAPAPPTESGAPPTGEGGPALTAAECDKQGGHVVGDIGDGATQRPDYRCHESGQPPVGRIRVEAGQPVPIEGAVCCR